MVSPVIFGCGLVEVLLQLVNFPVDLGQSAFTAVLVGLSLLVDMLQAFGFLSLMGKFCL